MSLNIAMTNIPQLQIVYVLTNPAMPGLVKIGKTTQEEVDLRMKQLYSTGVPVPFECVFACRVPDASVVEKALHHAFGQVRINPTREFFRIEPDRAFASSPDGLCGAWYPARVSSYLYRRGPPSHRQRPQNRDVSRPTMLFDYGN